MHDNIPRSCASVTYGSIDDAVKIIASFPSHGTIVHLAGWAARSHYCILGQAVVGGCPPNTIRACFSHGDVYPALWCIFSVLMFMSPSFRSAFRAMFYLGLFRIAPTGRRCLWGAPGTYAASSARYEQLSITVPSSPTSATPFPVRLAARPAVSVCLVAAMRDYLSGSW